MKKLATCAVAITGFIGTSAFAADMGVPAAPPPAPVWSWTGWYAGVNLGASFGRAKTDFNNNGPFTVTNAGIPATATFTIPPAFSDTQSPDGFMGGGQIGYNWQGVWLPYLVLGVEADFQGAVEKDNVIATNTFSSTAVLSGKVTETRTVTGSTFDDFSTKIEWFGTARVRAGYVWGNGNVMSYLTGGLAYGKVDLEGTSTVTTNFSDIATILRQGVVARNFSHNDVNIGWVAGYGTEGRLGNTNWTWKIEGLWMDLGTLDTPGVITGVTSPGNGFVVTTAGGPATLHTHFTDGILRGGLNYKFY